jgi:type II secretory pathway component PulK
MNRTARHSTASVLVIVLWASLGLVALTLTFGQSMLLSYRGADNDVAGRQAQQAIEGAIRYAQMIISTSETPGALPDPALFPAEAVPVGEATFWFIGRIDDGEPTDLPFWGIVDESSKLGINAIGGGTGAPQLTPAMLEGIPGMTAELAAAIIDWADTNEDVSDNGAESETYTLRQPCYAAKNARFESIEELALVNGATRYVLYGEDENLNGALDVNEDDGEESLPVDDGNGRLERGVLDYLTAFTREPNTKEDGTARVNVTRMSNAGVSEVLDELGANRKAAILAATGQAQLTSVAHFYKVAGITADEEAKIDADITTVTTPAENPFIFGRVNVNSASEAVLACIPGLSDKASSLVAARQSRAEQSASIKWFLDALDLETVIRAGPFITGRSYQFSVDVGAVGRNGRGYRRTWAVIDTSTGEPRVIYRRDLSHAGWALGREARQQLAVRKENR